MKEFLWCLWFDELERLCRWYPFLMWLRRNHYPGAGWYEHWYYNGLSNIPGTHKITGPSIGPFGAHVNAWHCQAWVQFHLETPEGAVPYDFVTQMMELECVAEDQPLWVKVPADWWNDERVPAEYRSKKD